MGFFFFEGRGEEAEGQEKTIYRGDCPKKGPLDSLQILGGLGNFIILLW